MPRSSDLLSIMPSTTPIRQDRILRIRELYNRLGYGGRSEQPLRDLSRTMHAWRHLHTHDDAAITRWSRYETQRHLSLLAEDFLNTSPHGEKFWPATGRPIPHAIPEYPEDRDNILQLLKQLFWRHSVQAVQNARYRRHRLKVQNSLESRPSTIEADVEDHLLPADILVAQQLQAELERSTLPELDIDFYIFTSRAFQTIKCHWKEASLRTLVEATLEGFFRTISHIIITPFPIQHIRFKLRTPYTETIFGIYHDNDAYFQTMKRTYIKEIGENLRRTRSHAGFEIWLHPCSSPGTCGYAP